MSEELKEEWTELVAQSKKFEKINESFFRKKAPKGKPDEPEMKDSELEEIAQIAEVREKADEEILSNPNVVGAATGFKIKADRVIPELCIQVLVEKKMGRRELKALGRKAIDKRIEGIRTDVIETGKIEALSFRGRYVPAFPGASIGHVGVTAGTLGCLVQDKVDHEFLILSNNHVLANSNNAEEGDSILQPGWFDGGTFPRDVIARLERFVPMVHRYNLIDAAVARPLDQRAVIASIPRLGIPRGTTEALMGRTYAKVGRTTQFTTGRATATDATILVNYGPGLIYQFRNQIVTTGMSAGGDSGSLLVDTASRAVGLLFAGSSVITIHNHISNVLMGLKVEMVTA
jgi:hypothetical protein